MWRRKRMDRHRRSGPNATQVFGRFPALYVAVCCISELDNVTRHVEGYAIAILPVFQWPEANVVGKAELAISYSGVSLT